ncbi:acyltransferase [Bradyrhizobium yuanmingense]|uniref:acyltransferase family protein n=1 Tax=Bradyrhizobium yuanmingense TaxID=108015 RepID=UPI000FE314F9|nr:acyltransferase [Bradyrhizobium yuanmingense]TGN89429.1 acyltransferase [Bradyrhizobium yuanmingense]
MVMDLCSSQLREVRASAKQPTTEGCTISGCGDSFRTRLEIVWNSKKMLALNNTNDTSVLLDAFRAAAAQMVCVGHGLVFFQVGSAARPPHLPLMQNIGVLLFFLMSGFLITATLVRRSSDPDYTFARYFVDRFSRIYSGLVPALAFVVVVDGLTIWLTAEPTILRYYDLSTLLASLAMLPGYHGIYDQSYLQWSAFGSASPLWTLGIEWQIYMFAGAAFFIITRRGLWLLLFLPLAFFGQTPLHYLAGSLQNDGVGAGLFSLWLAGASTFLLLNRFKIPPLLSATAAVLGMSAYCLSVVPGNEYAMSTYPPLALAFSGLIALSQRTAMVRSSRPVRLVADFSFTLYLIHYSLMTSVHFIFPQSGGWVAFIVVIIAANLAAWLIARFCEMKHKKLAEWISTRLHRAGRNFTRRAGLA